MIRVEIGKARGLVPKEIYGQFIEQALSCIDGGIYEPESAFADENGMRRDVIEKLGEMAPPVLRFPGGTVMCQYHWEDAIGPKETRIRRKNLIWGGELDPSFGTAELVLLCRKIGADPMICVNMASGTPEEAANWVEYCNGTGNTYYANLRRSHGYAEPFGVKYWCIGNECYAGPDIGIQNDVQIYSRDAMEFIKWMKLTDKSIRIVIVGCEREDWNKPVLDALHAVTDYFSVHHYSGEGDKGIYGPFEGEKNLRKMIKEVSELIETYPEKVTDFNPWYRFPAREKKISIALDEWNIWDFKEDETYGLLQTYCWRDALWTASILNFMIDTPQIGMANLAQSVNVLAPIVTEENGSWLQPIAYPLCLYRKKLLGERLSVKAEIPMLDGGVAGEIEAFSICAVRNTEGKIVVAAVNRDFDKDHTLCLSGDSLAGGKRGEMILLTGDAPESICSLTQSCVHEECVNICSDGIALPAGSIAVITFDK